MYNKSCMWQNQHCAPNKIGSTPRYCRRSAALIPAPLFAITVYWIASPGGLAQFAMVKVLFAGDCGGKVEVLFKRVETVNASAAGPFDVLLCTGGFFAATGKRWLLRAMKCVA
jgi:hypothetical protein